MQNQPITETINIESHVIDLRSAHTENVPNSATSAARTKIKPKRSGVVVAFPRPLNSVTRARKRPALPLKPTNRSRRVREYLTPSEVDKMIEVTRKRGGRTALRDALLITEASRHGLRAAELVALQWSQYDFAEHVLNAAWKGEVQWEVNWEHASGLSEWDEQARTLYAMRELK